MCQRRPNPGYTSAIFWTSVPAVAAVVSTIGTSVALIDSTPKRQLFFRIRTAVSIMSGTELEIFDRGLRLAEPRSLEIELSVGS